MFLLLLKHGAASSRCSLSLPLPLPRRPCQTERYQLVLGTGKQEPEPKLLVLMVVQKDKYEKWLFRVLVVLSELMVSETRHNGGGKGQRRGAAM